MYGGRAYVGMIEDGYPDRDCLIANIKTAGCKRVRLIPFMLVAGVHFKEDLAGPKDSWKAACEENGLAVTLETEGLGSNKAIIDIFCQHIQSALDVIPESIST
jgi:sirohydrochlorin cobaltochelatase